MALDIYAGKHVLYKNGNSGWLVGTLQETKVAEVNEQGVWLPIIPKNSKDEVHWAEINNIFLEATPLNEYIKDYPDYYMTKEDYIKFTDSEDFERAREEAYFTDGEYVYYPVSKFSKGWIEKQPFDYIVRND